MARRPVASTHRKGYLATFLVGVFLFSGLAPFSSPGSFASTQHPADARCETESSATSFDRSVVITAKRGDTVVVNNSQGTCTQLGTTASNETTSDPDGLWSSNEITVTSLPTGGSVTFPATITIDASAPDGAFNIVFADSTGDFRFRLTISVGTPPVISSISATVEDSQTTVTWEQASGSAATYEMQQSTTGDDTDNQWTAVAGDCSGTLDATLATQGCTVTGLDNGTPYFLRVRGTNAEGTSDWFVMGSPVTPSLPPTKPSGLTAQQNGTAVEARLVWVAPNLDNTFAPVTGYKIQVSTNGTTWTDSIPDTGNTNLSADVSISDTNGEVALVTGRSYFFRVAAINAAGVGDFVETTDSLTLKGPPGKVDLPDPGLVFTQLDSTTVRIEFDAPFDDGGDPITGYSAQWRTSATGGADDPQPAGDWVFVPSSSCSVESMGGICDITGLSAGSIDILVRAENASGVGALSMNPGRITVIGFSSPQEIEASALANQVTLEWKLPTSSGGVDFCRNSSYEVEQSTDGGAFSPVPGSPIAIECATEFAPQDGFFSGNLGDGTGYSFQVLAKNNGQTVFTVTPQFHPAGGGAGASLTWTTANVTEEEKSDMCPGGVYEIQKRTGTTDWVSASGFSTSPCRVLPAPDDASLTISSLANGTPYSFRVRAVRSFAGDWAEVGPVTPATVPDAPTSVTATRGDEEVLLSWTPPVFNGGAAITDYEYEVSSDRGDNFGSAVAVGSAATSVTVPDLTNGDTYVFRVTAINSVGSSTVSVVSNEATPAALPAVPTNLLAAWGSGQVALSWSPGGGGGQELTGHLVELSTDGGLTWSVAIANTGSALGNATVTGLTNGTSYRFRVSGISPVGTGLPLALTSDVIPSTTPGPISNLQATAGDGQAVLTWTAGDDGGSPITGYKVEKNDGNGWTVENANSLSDATTYTVAGLTNETAYRFRVTPINANGASVVSPPELANAVTPVAPPGVPGTPTATAGPGSATVTVATGTGGTPTSYLVTADPGGATCTVNGASGSCTITGLTAGTDYTFTATATNGAGTSSASTASDSVTPTVVVVSAPAPNTAGQGNQGPRRGLPAVVEIALTPRSTVSNFLAPVVTAPRSATTQQGGTTLGQAPSQAATPSGNGQSAVTSGPLATVGGQVVTVESTATSPTQLELQVGSVSLGVSVGNGSGTVGSNGSGANGSDALGMQLANGAATVFEGGGLTPGSAVQVVLPLGGDDSAVLAVLEVAEDGTFLGEAAFSTTPDGDPLPIGVRVVQLFTVDEDGNDVVIEVAVTIGQPDPTPAINRADGSVPALTPGEALGTSAGLPQAIEVRAIEEQKRAVVDGGDWSMAVDVASSTGGVQPVDSGAQLTLVRDESAMVSGSGFMAGTRADVWLFSEPTLLGTVTVDENGEFVGEVTIDGIVIPPGDHTLQLQGVGQDGYVKATSLGVAVDDVTAPMPADTTSSSLWMLMLAITGLAILLIAVFIVAVRRKMQKQ